MTTRTCKPKAIALAVILTAPLLYVIDIFIINMAIPAIKKGLNASDAAIQLVIAGYLLGSACFFIIAGRVGDYVGRKKVFFWGMLAFTLTSCICGMATNVLALNIARFLQGVSSAFMVTQSIALIQLLFAEPKERARAIGWYGITLSIAAIIGQMMGGYLADTHIIVEGWRLAFFINVPVGMLALWAIRRYLPETPGEPHNSGFDYYGAIAITLGLGTLIYSLTQGREQNWPLWSRALLLISVLVLLFFFHNQKRKSRSNRATLMNTGLFALKEFNIGLLAVLFHFMMHTAYLLMSAVYLQDGLRISALQCGACFIPHALLFMLSSAIAPRMLVRHGRNVLLAGLALILISFILQLFYFNSNTSFETATLLIGLYGLGNGLVLPFLLNVVLNGVPPQLAGVSSGIFSTLQQTASALGISIIGGVFYESVANSAFNKYTIGLHNGLKAGMLCLILVALLLGFLPKTFSNQPEAIVAE
jgi:EmrB/QacA subfamily drug resistance transporter